MNIPKAVGFFAQCTRWPSFVFLLVGLGFSSAANPQLSAAEPLKAGQWWGTFELGGAQVDRTAPGFSNNSGRFYLGLEGGLAINAHLLLGAELSGWLVQSENTQDPTKGSGISQVFAVARIYPQADSPLHIQVGAGSISGWNNSPSATGGHGSGWEIGLGYDVKFGPHGAFTPFVRYNQGKAGNQKSSAVTVGLGFTWR